MKYVNLCNLNGRQFRYKTRIKNGKKWNISQKMSIFPKIAIFWISLHKIKKLTKFRKNVKFDTLFDHFLTHFLAKNGSFFGQKKGPKMGPFLARFWTPFLDPIFGPLFDQFLDTQLQWGLPKMGDFGSPFLTIFWPIFGPKMDQFLVQKWPQKWPQKGVQKWTHFLTHFWPKITLFFEQNLKKPKKIRYRKRAVLINSETSIF